MMKKMISIFVASQIILAAQAEAIPNLIVNGDFETGDFTGWMTDTQTSGGDWFIYSGSSTPMSHFPFIAPPDGVYAAIADEQNPSSMILYQDVFLSPGPIYTLQFTYYYNNHNSRFYAPDTLEVAGEPNQQARVDIMNPSAPLYSTLPGDVLENVLITRPGSPFILEPTVKYADLTPYGGSTVRVRFAVADNEFYFNLGIDGVAILPNFVVPAGNLAGSVVKNKFGMQTDRIYKLDWHSSVTREVIHYLIYRNDQLIATVENKIGALTYEDHNRKKNEVNTYKVISVVSDVLQSDPVSVTIP